FSIKGKVVDATTSAPLEFTTVSVKKMRDSSLVSGAITSATGEFRIDNIGPGGYMVEIAFIGYEKYVQRVGMRPGEAPPVTDLGTIKLKVSATTLQGAEITADKAFMMSNIDKKTYNTDQLAVTAGGNVKNVLENIPSVEIDQEGTVSLRGNENVTILIDGRPSGLTGSGGKSLLESLPASAIESVEVITNPSAKYDPDGISGIINIVTKKNRLQGFTGSVGANTSFGGRYGFTGSLSLRKGKWNVYTNYGFTRDKTFSEGNSYRETYFRPDTVDVISQNENGNNSRTSQNIKFGVDWNANDRNTISTSAMLNIGNSDDDNNILYRFYELGVPGDSLSRRITIGSGTNRNLDADFVWKHFFKKKGQLLNFTATASYDLNKPENDYSDGEYVSEYVPGTSFNLERDRTVNNNTNYTISADYEHPISDDKKLETGLKSTIREFDTDLVFEEFSNGSYVSDTNRTNRFVFSDVLHAAYAQYRQSLGKFGYQVGLRSEYATTEANLITTDSIFNKDYFSVYPSAFITYKPSQKNSWKATYSRRINRPRRNALNPFPNYDDPRNVRIGNPDLDPEYSDSYEIENMRYIGKFSLTSTLYARLTKDNIQRYRRVTNDSLQITVVTWENLAYARNYGGEFILNGSPFKWWNITLSTNIYYNMLSAKNLQEDLSSESWTASGRVFTTFKPFKYTDLQITYFYRPRMKVTQGTMKDMQMLTIAASRKVLKEKGVVSVRVSDPFNIQRFGFEFEDVTYFQDFTRKRQSRFVTVSFSYRFGELRDREQQRMRDRSREDMDMEG
ncbi:MAG: TonB-dependent receptor domain-containing protein, partial [Bacteroidota bacterium]